MLYLLGPLDANFHPPYIGDSLIGQETRVSYAKVRDYAIPEGLLYEGDNVIAVRVFGNFSRKVAKKAGASLLCAFGENFNGEMPLG